jgi:hypothetical protein
MARFPPRLFVVRRKVYKRFIRPVKIRNNPRVLAYLFNKKRVIGLKAALKGLGLYFVREWRKRF